MATACPDHVARLRAVLAAARRDYRQLELLAQEGLQTLQVRSHQRVLTLAVAPAVGAALLPALLADAQARVQHGEAQLAQALHGAGTPVQLLPTT